MIEFQKVSKAYGRKPAVIGLDLTIPQGELFALLGPNGAGKTTTLKMLVGLLWPDEGRILVCGYDATHQPRESARRLGYVPDEPHLYDKLTGREFLAFLAEMHGLDRRQAAARIEREIGRFELGEFIDQLTESLSHGMRQRIAFAAALLHDPAVLVIDEPMVGLDPRSARLVKDLLRTLADRGTTILMSTHTLAVVEEIADRIGIIHQGRLHFDGTLQALRQRLGQHDGSLERLFLSLTEQLDSTDPGSAGLAAAPQPAADRPPGRPDDATS